jgi:hypothetical protein
MVASRDVLKDENKLLVDLEKTASGSPLGRDWARYFREWRDGNEDLIPQSDSAFNQELADEIKRLEKMRNSLAGESSAGAKFWIDMLNLDIENAKQLKL